MYGRGEDGEIFGGFVRQSGATMDVCGQFSGILEGTGEGGKIGELELPREETPTSLLDSGQAFSGCKRRRERRRYSRSGDASP